MGNSSSTPFNYEAQLLSDRPAADLLQSIEVPDPNQPANASVPRRLRGLENGLKSRPYPKENNGQGYATIYECFYRGVRVAANHPCFGTRVFVTEGGNANGSSNGAVAPAPVAEAPAAAAPAPSSDEEQKQPESAAAAASSVADVASVEVVVASAPTVVAATPAKYKIEDKMPVRGAYVWDTYTEVAEAATALGTGLSSLGYAQHTNVGIFSSNRAEWMVSALGLYGQNMRVVSLYASLGEGAVEFIINHADVPVVLVSKQNLPALIKSLANLKNVKHIIQWDVNPKYNNIEEVVSEADKATCKEAGIELLGFGEVQARGRASGLKTNPAGPEDLAYIMYTSGTTGNPKGVMLLHRNVTATVACVEPVFSLTEKDTYLSYLPLAHIFETIAETAILIAGGSIGFFQDNIKKLTADMCDVKPTLFCGVPRVFTRIHQVVMNGVAEQSCLVKWFFNKAFQAQSELVRQGRPVDAGYDKKVFAKLRAKMGLENVRVLVTGAAPIAPYLAEFLKVVSGGRAVLEGYGMTEASAATSIGMVGDRNLGHTGPPVSCAEVRLEDIPDMNYLHTDPHPRGEVCVRGPAVFAGYWKDEENTKATIIDGWLHTGDVGRFNPNGTLSIIDRKKNMFKLSQGEYVAIERVEQAYQKAGMVGQVWCYGNSFKSFLLGVVVPAAEPTAAFLLSKGYWPRSEKESTKLAAETFQADWKTAVIDADPARKAELRAWVLENLRAQEKGLKGFERVKDWVIATDINGMGMVFTEQNDTLTPTFKLRRPQLLQKYIQQLKQMYADNGEPVAPDEKWPGEV